MHLIIILITVRIGIPVPTDAGIYFLSFSIISQNNLAHRSLPSSSQEMPPPSPRNKYDHAFEAKRRLKREVIHRLASGNKTHSEMAEVHHVLPQRDNFVLCETGKLVNPDDASSVALEDTLGEVARRKCCTGSPDEWELQKEAWG